MSTVRVRAVHAIARHMGFAALLDITAQRGIKRHQQLASTSTKWHRLALYTFNYIGAISAGPNSFNGVLLALLGLSASRRLPRNFRSWQHPSPPLCLAGHRRSEAAMAFFILGEES